MEIDMALAPSWAQILPQPPPAAKYTIGDTIRMFDRRTVEVGGGWGHRDHAGGRYCGGAVSLKKADDSAFPLPSDLASRSLSLGPGGQALARRAAVRTGGHTIPFLITATRRGGSACPSRPICSSSSDGRAPPSQGGGRGFESRLLLHGSCVRRASQNKCRERHGAVPYEKTIHWRIKT